MSCANAGAPIYCWYFYFLNHIQFLYFPTCPYAQKWRNLFWTGKIHDHRSMGLNLAQLLSLISKERQETSPNEQGIVGKLHDTHNPQKKERAKRRHKRRESKLSTVWIFPPFLKHLRKFSSVNQSTYKLNGPSNFN